jgi:DNA polymerase-4
MARELCANLQRRGRSGRTVGIKVRLDDFTTVTRARTLPLPTADEDIVQGVALELLRAYDPQRPVRLLGVRVAGLSHGDGDRREGEEGDEARERVQLAMPL